MQQNRRKLIILLFSVLILALVAVMILSPSASIQSVRLPDGTLVRLEGVTYGRRHQFIRRTWYSWLTGSNKVEVETEKDALVFWVSSHEASSGTEPDFQTQDIFDERGQKIAQSRPDHLHSESTTSFFFGRQSRMSADAFKAEAFPRRGQMVGLRLYLEGSQTPAAEFTAPNPMPGSYPVWEAEPYPITKRDGDLTLTLTGLQTGITYESTAKPALPGQSAFTRATLLHLQR